MMKKLGKKLFKIAFKSSLLAIATKAGAVLLKKLDKDGDLADKADNFIDDKAEKAKTAAKAGVRKGIDIAKKDHKPNIHLVSDKDVHNSPDPDFDKPSF